MKNYSFVEEASPAVSNILAVGGMTNLGITVGDLIGRNAGRYVSRTKTLNLKNKDISWTDPVFSEIVRKSLLEAKNKIKLAKEWLESCDPQDKKRAEIEYMEAIEDYKEMQRDIRRRNASRWMQEYKEALADIKSKKYAKVGRIAGGATGFGGTGVRLVFGK